MTKTLSALSTSRLLPSIVAVALLATCSLELEAAGPRGAGRARLSRDLADRLGSGRSRAVRVIVSEDDARIERLAARHGARIAKRLEGAAVLEIAERTLDAMSDDEETAHLSGDVPVQRLMSVTTEATGADQVWQGRVAAAHGYTAAALASRSSTPGSPPTAPSGAGSSRRWTSPTRGAAARRIRTRHPRRRDHRRTHDTGYAGVAPGSHIVSA